MYWLDLSRRDGVLTALRQEMRYSERMTEGKMVYRLDMNKRGGILTGHGQQRWCTDMTWAVEVVVF